MPQIFVEHESHNGRQSYLIEHSDTVDSLKASIEETEGIPADNCTLLFNGVELSSLEDLSEESTVILRSSTNIVIVKTGDGELLPFRLDFDSTFAELLRQISETKKIPAGKHILKFDKKEMDPDATLRDSNIEDGSLLHLVVIPGRSPQSAIPRPVIRAEVEACFNWDGEMEDPGIEGLPLQKGRTIYVLNMITTGWCLGSYKEGGENAGVFPRNYVKILRLLRSEFKDDLGEDDVLSEPQSPTSISTSASASASPVPVQPKQSFKTTLKKMLRSLLCWMPATNNIHHSITLEPDVKPEGLSIMPDKGPALPPFPYADERALSFHVPLSDRGLSFLQVEMTFSRSESSGKRADVTLKCCTVPPRRVSSVVLSFQFKSNKVQDLQPIEESGPSTLTDISKTNHSAASFSGGFNQYGANLGVQYTKGKEKTKQATRSTQMKIKGTVVDSDTARWEMEEDTGVGGQFGLPQEVRMSFSLNFRPPEVVWKCHVRHAKDSSTKQVYADRTVAV